MNHTTVRHVADSHREASHSSRTPCAAKKKMFPNNGQNVGSHIVIYCHILSFFVTFCHFLSFFHFFENVNSHFKNVNSHFRVP